VHLHIWSDITTGVTASLSSYQPEILGEIMYEQQQQPQSQYPRLGKVYFNPQQNMPITVLLNLEQLQQLMQIASQIPPRADGKAQSVKLMAKLFPQERNPGQFDGTLTYLQPNQPPAQPAQPVYQMAYQPQGQFQQQYPQAQPPQHAQPQYQQPQPQYPQPQPQPQYAPAPQQYAPAPQPQYAPQPQQDWGQFQQQVAPQGALPIPQVGESPWA